METGYDCIFFHDEADVTMVSLLLEAARSDQSVTRIFNDKDMVVLLAYWVNQADLQCKVQMGRWDGSILDMHTTCADIGQKCLQLLEWL